MYACRNLSFGGFPEKQRIKNNRREDCNLLLMVP
jgi:hypothetical protein